MITVRQAAERVGRDPETVRRWIRSGRLRARKVGNQYAIDHDDLEAAVADEFEMSALPEEWKTEPYINVVRAIQLSRKGH